MYLTLTDHLLLHHNHHQTRHHLLRLRRRPRQNHHERPRLQVLQEPRIWKPLFPVRQPHSISSTLTNTSLSRYIYDDIFYVTNGRIAQVSFGVRATGASGCPEDIDMSPEECTRGFRQIADGCNENENVKQGGVYHETCVEWDINPNLKGIGESSCGGDTIWPILGDH